MMPSDERAQRIAQLEESLRLPLPAGIRRQFEQELDDLRTPTASSATLPSPTPASSGVVHVQGEARIYGPTVGANLGTIIYNGAPGDEQREQLVRYLDRVAHKMQRLRLGGLSPLDDKGMQLPNVYVMLATQNRVRVETGPPALVKHFFVDDDPHNSLKLEYDPDHALPIDAIVYARAVAVPDSDEADTSSAIHYLDRSVLGVEAANKHECFVLLGDPGGGKSTFMRHLAWALAERGLDKIDSTTALFHWPDEARLLPVLLPLRKLAGRIAAEGPDVATVSAALRDEMEREYDARRADEVLDKALANGGALLLFDGLDEVPLAAVPGQTAGRATTLRTVREFVELHGRARAIVTCRTRAFDQALRDCLGWHVETLAPLTLGQIRHFVRAWYAELVTRGSLDREGAERQQRALIEAIVERPKLGQMAGTPLLLTMMALACARRLLPGRSGLLRRPGHRRQRVGVDGRSVALLSGRGAGVRGDKQAGVAGRQLFL